MPLDLSRIKALCFDVDGTLRDTDDQYVKRFARILRLIKPLLPGSDPHKAARWLVMRLESPANTLFSLPDRFGLDDEIAALGNWFYQRGIGRTSHQFEIIPATQSVLSQLAPHYPLAVVTARGKRATLAFLNHFDLTQHFDHIATALTAQRSKPHPAPILWAAQQMAVYPQDCLMIGDTTVDMLAGKAAGAQIIGVLSGFGEEAELRAAGADLILQSVAELPDILIKKS